MEMPWWDSYPLRMTTYAQQEGESGVKQFVEDGFSEMGGMI